MLKSFKTEINPTIDQIQKINKTIGTCRYVYNFYIAYNKENYASEKKFISGMDFQKWLNNTYLKENPEYLWIKEVSSKSVKKSIMNAENAYKRFFKHQTNFPKYKKKNRTDVKMYFVKNSNTDTICERHRIKIPTLGWVMLKEKGYIPITKQGYIIKSGTVSKKADRYYVSVLIDIPETEKSELNNFGLGIDLGIKNFAIVSNGIIKKNVNKTPKLKKLEKKLKREQRSLSRRYEDLKKRKEKMKGEATKQNIQKQVLKVQKLHCKINNIRTDYINKTIAEIVKTKPSYITIEDLNVKGMMKNRHLSKAIQQQKLYEFRRQIEYKSAWNNIPVIIADRFFPSSKLCSCCGNIKKDLKLSDRIYKCECGNVIDRDYQAALNLKRYGENVLKQSVS